MRKKIIVAVAWGLLFAALAAVYISVVEGKLSRYDIFYNADALYIPALYRELASGYRLSGWNPPPVPYFFPDIPLFLLVNFLVGNFHLAIVLFGVIQFLAFIIGLILISNQVFGPRKRIQFLILIAGIVTGLLFSTGKFLALMPIFVSNYHFGALLSSIFSSLLIIRLLRIGPDSSTGSVTHYGVLFLIALLTIASDAIYLIQFLVPALFGFWLLLLASKISLRQLFRFYFALIPAAPLGYWLNRTLLIYRTARPPEKITLGIIAENIVQAKQGLISGWTQGSWFPKAWMPAFTIICTCFVVLTLIVVLRLLCRGMRRNSEAPQSRFRGLRMIVFTIGLFGTVLPILTVRYRWIFWGTFVLTSAYLWGVSRKRDVQGSGEDGRALYLFSYFLSMVVATVGASLVSGVSLSRYLLPALLIPLFFGWPFLLASSKRFVKAWDHSGGQIGVILILIVLLFLFGNLSQITQLSKLSDFYPDNVRCLDSYAARKHIHNGIAQYWRARPITMLSKKNLLIVQAKPNLYPMHWINNLNMYNNLFEFIITDTDMKDAWRINAQRVRAKFGNPASSNSCNDFNVLVYNRPEDTAFQRQFHQLFNFSFDAVQLSSETGRIIGSGRIADPGSSAKGCLAKSPDLNLWIGDYQFEIAYFASPNNGSPVGTWDVVLHTPENEQIILKKGKIELDGEGVISGVASIRQSGRTEIRTFYQGRGVLRIDALRIRRLK
jgi:hypothetical protein